MKLKLIIIFLIAAVIVLLSVLVSVNKNKIAYGMRIANIPVGGLSQEGAGAKIKNLAEEFQKKDIVLKYRTDKNKNDIWTASPEELGIEINIDSTINKAVNIGRRKNIFYSFSQQFLAFFRFYNLPLAHRVNELKLEDFIKEKLDSLDNPAINASFAYSQERQDFIPTASSEGRVIERDSFKLQLHKKIENLAKDDIFLNLINDQPEVLENETEDALILAKKILADAPYELIISDPAKISSSQIILTKEELLSFIKFIPVQEKNNLDNKILGVTLDEKALNDYLTALSPSINRNPINAQLMVSDDRVVSFSLSQDGINLDIKKNVVKIKKEILDNNSANKEIKLELILTSPKIATSDIDNLGITSLLGKGVSNFAGSPASRIANIKVGAAKFNGTLLEPEEEFSFNAVLGEVGPEQGYKPELTIKNYGMVYEYGGGLCQVSTTAFRGAIYAGLPIEERFPHAFPVKYYNPQGFDATIYPPHPDLRFINNTPAHLLIQTKIKGNELIFEFYGTDDGRKIEVIGPVQYDTKSDGSMKAKLTRKIYDKDGNLLKESIFNSSYKSPALYPVQRNPLE